MSERLTLREMQDENVRVLRKFSELCDMLGLRYFIAYGTLLGAVRHNGFIPWDDDLDVWMFREDFNTFRKYCRLHQNELKPYRYICRENTKNYRYGIPRLTNLEFQVYADCANYNNPRMGSYIDIYPLDNLGDNKILGDIMERLIYIKNQLFHVYVDGESYSGRGGAVKKILHKIMRRIKGNEYQKHIDTDVEALLRITKKRKQKYIGVSVWETSGYRYLSAKFFEKAVMHEFEGRKYPAPARYDELLQIIYGDYMELPPKEKQVPEHGYYMVRVR